MDVQEVAELLRSRDGCWKHSESQRDGFLGFGVGVVYRERSVLCLDVVEMPLTHWNS